MWAKADCCPPCKEKEQLATLGLVEQQADEAGHALSQTIFSSYGQQLEKIHNYTTDIKKNNDFDYRENSC